MPKQVRDRSANQRRLRIEHLEDRRLLAVLTVQNNLDDTLANLAGDGELSLREAIEIANNPGTMIDGYVSNDVEDTIEFASPFFDEPRTILLEDGELEITETLTIDGPGQELLVIDAQEVSRVLHFTTEVGNLSLEGLTLTGGGDTLDGGGIYFNSQGMLKLSGTTVTGNSLRANPNARGGGIFATSGSVSLFDSTVSYNSAFDRGGGIVTLSGDVIVNNSSVSGNTVSGLAPEAIAGGIWSSGTIMLMDAVVQNNSVIGYRGLGGGIATSEGITAVNSVISENRTVGAQSRGGGIFLSGGSLTLMNSILSGNVATRNGQFGDTHGGGIATSSFFDGDIQVFGSEILHNSSDGNGGGISAIDANVTLTDSHISGNTSAGEGGGIFGSSGGSISATDSTFKGNYSADGGGAIRASSSTVRLTNSEVSNNRSGDEGGGIRTTTGDVVLSNSTLSGNRAAGISGGIFTSMGTVVLRHTTVAGNVSVEPRGVIHIFNPLNSSGLHLHSSVVAGNLDEDGLPHDLVQDLASNVASKLTANNSLIGSAEITITGTSNQIGTVENPLDPLLGPLSDNGGPTHTHALLPGSPALDAGDPSIVFDPGEFDQRGTPFSRVATGVLLGIPQQRIDIGAYEAQSPPSADFVDDDHLNGQDFLTWQLGFGLTENATRADGDSDGDGDVDLSDLAAWRVSYGQTEAPPPPLGASGQGAVASDPIASSSVDAVLGVMGSENEQQVVVVADQAFAEILPEDHDDTLSPILTVQVETSDFRVDVSDEEHALFAALAEDLLGSAL